MLTIGELKQQICSINNSIHQDLFGLGLRKQSVDFVANKILIVDVSARASVLVTLTNKHPDKVAEIDKLLLEEYKLRFIRDFKEKLNIEIKAVLKDYDAATEHAGTIIILDKAVNDYCRE